MTALGAGQSGAENEISGTIPIYADWTEDIYFFEPDGDAMDLDGLAFKMQFRCDPSQTSADVTLSTAAGTLSLVDDGGSVTSILRISADAGTFANYAGDMICDLIGIDGSNNVTLYGHGVVKFTNNPVAI
jgi:hypothetical protein